MNKALQHHCQPKEEFGHQVGCVLALDFKLKDGDSFMDSSVYGHLCVNHGSKWQLDGRYFNGVDDYVEVPRVIQDDWTIEIRVKTEDTRSGAQWYEGEGLVDGEVSGGANDFGTASLNGKFAFGVGNPDTTIQSTTSINDNVWHHCIATRVAATGIMKVYIDRILENSKIGPTGTKNSPPRITIGMLQTNVFHLNGLIDEVRIYNRALSSAEISAIYNATK